MCVWVDVAFTAMGWGEVEFATPLGGECPPWPGKTLTMDEKKKKNLPSEIYTAECLLFLFLSSFFSLSFLLAP